MDFTIRQAIKDDIKPKDLVHYQAWTEIFK